MGAATGDGEGIRMEEKKEGGLPSEVPSNFSAVVARMNYCM